MHCQGEQDTDESSSSEMDAVEDSRMDEGQSVEEDSFGWNWSLCVCAHI